MKNKLTYIILIIIVVACKSQDDSAKTDSSEEFVFPVFLDNRDITEERADIRWLEDGNHRPLYLGLIKDTIKVKPLSGHLIAPPREDGEPIPEGTKGEFDDYFLDWEVFKPYKSWDSVKLKIQIDTTQFISNVGKKAYPVVIENLHTDTIYIGYGRYIPIITEALNEKGEWIPIEYRYRYMCGNGAASIILPPGQIAVTSEFIYSGKYQTKLRLKLGDNYSDEFRGSINKTQFESEFDKNGNSRYVPNSTYSPAQ